MDETPPVDVVVRDTVQLLRETDPVTDEHGRQWATFEPDGEPSVLALPGPVITLDLPGDQELSLDAAQRRLGLRIVPYGVVAEHPRYGRLMFEPGAFGSVEPRSVRLRMDHMDPPTGLGRTFTDRPDGAYMEFQVSETTRGNDQLALAKDGTSRGASIGFADVPGAPQLRQIDGKRTTVYPPNSAVLAEVSTTWQPTFSEAGVMYALHTQEKETASMPPTETQEAPAVGAAINYVELSEAIASAVARVQSDAARDERMEKLLTGFDQMIEMQRAQFTPPAGQPVRKAKLEDWVNVTLRKLAGEQVSPTALKELALDDIVTTEQPGLVPNILLPDYDDVINRDRPFLQSTRNVRPPSTGTSLILPLLTSRQSGGSQAGPAEKGAITVTTAMKVGTGTFAYKPVFGGADISIQMILRSDRSFMDLLTAELGEAYALDCETKAIAALIAGYTDSGTNAHLPVDGGTMDPEDPKFGDAWQNSIVACKRAPTHIWMSAAAVGAFIDAKAPLTNAPLYSNLAAAFTAGQGAGGALSGLTPIYVPALDATAVDVLIGPARGFVWAEDPALTLQADVPSTAGRDVGLVGGIFPAPRYADAFTYYAIGS